MLRRLGLMGFIYSGVQVALMSFYVLYLVDELSFSYASDVVLIDIDVYSIAIPTVGFVYAILRYPR